MRDGKQPPLAWDAFQRMGTTLFELEARAGYEVFHGAGDQDFARPS
jgi:hypothetical protein